MQKLKALTVPAAFFLLFLIAATLPAAASDWVEVAENIDGWVYFVDLESIQADRYDSRATVWEMTVYPDNSYTKTLCTYDFSDRTYRDIAEYEYDQNDRMTNSDTTPADWKHVIPDTVGESIYLAVKSWLGW